MRDSSGMHFSPPETPSTMEKPCNLCHKPLLVVEAQHDLEWGWGHERCVSDISTKGS